MWANGHHHAHLGGGAGPEAPRAAGTYPAAPSQQAWQQQQQQQPQGLGSAANGNASSSPALLDQEEAQHHLALLSLAASIRESVRVSQQQHGGNGATSSRAIQEKQLQDRLAQFRSRIRELELLAEEQDE